MLTVLFGGCSSLGKPGLVVPRPPEKSPRKEVPTQIMGKSSVNANQLAKFVKVNNPSVDLSKVERLALFYIKEAATEGVNSDIAFVQMCLETGFLKFGGLVKPEMNNFCGLGSIGPEQPGLWFPTEEIGVRAHIQHLKAYGSDKPLVLALVDPRYKYVNPKGKSPSFYGLAGTWAMDKEYAIKIERLLDKLVNEDF